MVQILTIVQNTLFKLRPEQASQLGDREKYAVSAGTTFELHSYAYADVNGDFNGHIRVALRNQTLNGLNTWFVYGKHITVEANGEVVYPHEEQVSNPILWINANTVLKRRPIQSSLLPDSAKFSVRSGRSFELQSYAFEDERGDFDAHIRFALLHPSDFINGLNTWFVYDRHAYVEFDGRIVYPPEDPNLPILRITQDTVLKRRPLPASSLPPSEQVSITQGTLLRLQSYAYADASGSFNRHIKFTLRYVSEEINGFNTWFVYDGHARVEIQGRVVYPPPQPSPSPPPPSYVGKPFRLPGFSSTFYTDQPIIPNGNFTWGEATKNATRIPETRAITENIVELARLLERARSQIGRPFVVNSWYRPPAVNSAVGGASRSQHLFGKAVDIVVPGLSGRTVANSLMAWWPGGMGIYSNLPSVVHLDTGGKRYWGF